MSPRVPTAFRPLETSFLFDEEPIMRRAATSVPLSMSYDGSDPYAPERLQLLSRLEQRWCPSRPATCGPPRSSTCVAPVPRRSFGSRPSSSSSVSLSSFDEDAACLELRGIFGHGEEVSSSRSSSATLSPYGRRSVTPTSADGGFFPLEEIVVNSHSPISRASNPMPLDLGFGSAY
ncbi:hypothetical protein GGH94_003674 [Coemansia aciculifera]|uniref:Uncharacterized protein n=1 Tax=Coemansia aciculifera TaxID=417176 RepID=A0A9W8M2X5_9FUNG|nr:hypothetical protein GGH94_003674 [Coemansia aciculifera]KAJ2873020.1 hypothetical protein GGH93_003570 [Coemansia aciculifera]KAJ2884722.1 hypothetical protein H4R27_001883 [Coemansia aciculifera]